MKVLNECKMFTSEQLDKIEQHYNAKYVLESCLIDSTGQWANFPAAFFYTEEKHPTGSNYFALFFDEQGHLMITNGGPSIEGITFWGIEAEGEVAYSRYRHDYVTHKNDTFVDGGRDYFRVGGDQFDDYNKVCFKVVNGNIEIDEYPFVPDFDYHNREYN
jgi:hypothetical protein